MKEALVVQPDEAFENSACHDNAYAWVQLKHHTPVCPGACAFYNGLFYLRGGGGGGGVYGPAVHKVG